MIGSLSERTWKEQFPLLNSNHALRSKLERIRSLDVMWYELNGYRVFKDEDAGSADAVKGAWIPLPISHQVHLFKRHGLFDNVNHIPINPWMERNEKTEGLLKVFNQSYHSPWPKYNAYLKDWVNTACRYKVINESSFRPFSQYGGHPVEADFVHHEVQAPLGADTTNKRVHRELLEQRFGNTEPLRIGNMFNDTGLLQDMFSYKYSPSANVAKEEKGKHTDRFRISNFLAYARVHTIMALASANPGTSDLSMTRVARNFFRFHVDTYKCAGKENNTDGVPVILGYIINKVTDSETKPITFIAGTLNCINIHLSKFCSSSANLSEKVCKLYKLSYFNAASMIFERLLRHERTKFRHEKNFHIARSKNPTLTPESFYKYLVELKEEHITFLSHTVLGMLQQMGVSDKELPLSILETRDVYQDPSIPRSKYMLPQDYDTPEIENMVDEMDFSTESADLTQLSLMSLTPPDQRINGLLKLKEQPELVDTEYLKTQVQKRVVKENSNLWKDYSRKVIKAALGVQWLEKNQTKLIFDADKFKDPEEEAEKIGIRKMSSLKARDSELSMRQRNDMAGQSTENDSAQDVSKKSTMILCKKM